MTEDSHETPSRTWILDDDGVPTEQPARGIALVVLRTLSRGELRREALVQNLAVMEHEGLHRGRRGKEWKSRFGLDEDHGPIFDEVLDVLLASGRLSTEGDIPAGWVRFVHSARFVEIAGARCGMEANARIRLSKVFPDEDVDQAVDFLVGVRNVFGLHRSPDGSHVLVPDGIAVSDGVVSARGACLVRVSGGSVSIRILGNQGFRVAWDARSRRLDVRLDLVRGMPFPSRPHLGRKDRKELLALPILSFTKRSSGLVLLPGILRRSLEQVLRPNRRMFDDWMGRRSTDAEWRCLSRVLARRSLGDSGRVLQRMLCSMLEPEARRAALRSVDADLGLYCWYAGKGRRNGEWRRQAGRDWPLFAALLPEFEKEIDAGLPFRTLMAERLGMSPARLSELKGMTWNRFTSDGQRGLLEDGPIRKAVRLLPDGVPLHRVVGLDPAGRSVGKPGSHQSSGRLRRLQLLVRFTELFGGEAPVGMGPMMVRDPEKAFAAMEDPTLLDAVARTTPFAFLANLSRVPECRDAGHVLSEPISRILFEGAVGPEGSLKAWRRFSDRYHREIGATSAAFAAEAEALRADTGLVPMEWTPTDGRWECPGGGIEWLTTHLALLDEGREMAHCVSSYFDAMRSGRCCIGKVVGVDGSRGTVELLPVKQKRARIVDGEKREIAVPVGLRVAQFRTFRNGKPSDACAAVLAAFMQGLGQGSIRPDWERFEAMSANNVRFSGRWLPPEHLVAEADPIRAYALSRSLLPDRLRDLPLDALVDMHDAAARPFYVPVPVPFGAFVEQAAANF